MERPAQFFFPLTISGKYTGIETKKGGRVFLEYERFAPTRISFFGNTRPLQMKSYGEECVYTNYTRAIPTRSF